MLVIRCHCDRLVAGSCILVTKHVKGFPILYSKEFVVHRPMPNYLPSHLPLTILVQIIVVANKLGCESKSRWLELSLFIIHLYTYNAVADVYLAFSLFRENTGLCGSFHIICGVIQGVPLLPATNHLPNGFLSVFSLPSLLVVCILLIELYTSSHRTALVLVVAIKRFAGLGVLLQFSHVGLA